jgi:hypothetical protein
LLANLIARKYSFGSRSLRYTGVPRSPGIRASSSARISAIIRCSAPGFSVVRATVPYMDFSSPAAELDPRWWPPG